MPKNDIGGFFVSLGLNPDKNSFETGQKLIDAVSTSLNKLIGTARNAAVVLATTAVATGAVESANYKTATKIGITTEKLNELKAAAKIAGVNADGLVGSVGKLANVMNHLTIDGSGLEAYSKQLAELGMGFDELIGMDPAAAFEKIISTAQGKLDGTNMTRITTIVGDILGESGADLFVELERQGKTIEQFMAGARATQFTTDKDTQNAANFSNEINTLRATIESIGKLLGADVGGVMTPYLKSLNDWIQKNGEPIKKSIENISSVVDKIFGALSPYLSNIGGMVLGLLSGDMEMANAAGTALGLDVAEAVTGKDLKESYENKTAILNAVAKIAGPGKKVAFESLPEELQAAILRELEKDPSWKIGALKKMPKLKDGIMRPDGTVAQVAPDDWVFAARNLGDLAKAFIPQGAGAGTQIAEYSIVQNFTVNGGSDLPQVIRQQAYRGTQEGLLAAMNQSSQRTQLMSGTR